MENNDVTAISLGTKEAAMRGQKYIKNLYDDILNAIFVAFNSEFCTFRDQTLFLQKLRNQILFLCENFETKLCLWQNFNQILFSAIFSELNFTCKVNRFAIKFYFYKLFRDQTLFYAFNDPKIHVFQDTGHSHTNIVTINGAN